MPKDEVDVRVRDQLAACVDGVGISGCSDPRSVDDLADEAQVYFGRYHPARVANLGDGDRHVRLRAALKVDTSEVPMLRPRANELCAPGEIDPAVEPVDLEWRGADPLLPGRVQVGQLADELLPPEQAVKVLVTLREPRLSLLDRRLRRRLQLP